MKKIGLFYGTKTIKTASIASIVLDAFGDINIDLVPIENAWQKDFESYDNLIIGTSTWFDGELPAYWDEVIPELASLDMKNKKVAIFGLGNQEEYPDNFVDGIGLLAETFETAGAKIVGFTSTEGYNFSRSRASVGNQFKGLAIDMENQKDKTEKRVLDWVEKLKIEFK